MAKYGLGGGKYAKLADIIQLPGALPELSEITVGVMWEAYLEWKKTVVEETTFRAKYAAKYSNALNGRVWDKSKGLFKSSSSQLAAMTLDNRTPIDEALGCIKMHDKPSFISALSAAFEFTKSKGLIVNSTTTNPFDSGKFSTPTITTQEKYAPKMVDGKLVEWHELQDEKSLESDRRAFTKAERDVIIKAFYESDKFSCRRLAPLVEFYFLTGCRTSEALPITWADIDFTRNLIRFSKSLGANTGKIKTTKTSETRLFYFSESSRLKALLLGLKSSSNSDLVFAGTKNRYLSSNALTKLWSNRKMVKRSISGEEIEYFYPGVVSQLVHDGRLSGYLSPYHTRHTYITLTAHANGHNTDALLHIASACGNSVDVILRHYLGRSETTEILEV